MSPNKIAINYSLNDPHADGLGHRLYQVLMGYLDGTLSRPLDLGREDHRGGAWAKDPGGDPTDASRHRDPQMIYAEAFDYAQPGKTEREIAEFMHRRVEDWD